MTRRDRLAARLRAEARGVYQTFTIQHHNSDGEKFLMVALLVVWGVITIGIAFGYAEDTPVYTMLTAVVWALVGRVWGGELSVVGKRGKGGGKGGMGKPPNPPLR